MITKFFSSKKLIYPLFLILFVGPFWLLHTFMTIEELKIYSTLSFLGTILLSAYLEKIKPFDGRFKPSQKQFWLDSFFTFIQLPIISLFIEWIGKVWKAHNWFSLSQYWPHQWNDYYQVLFILIFCELLYYVYHYLGHRSDLLWTLHRYHHQFPTVYWNNSATFHFLDLFLSAFFYLFPLLIFQVDYHVQYLFVTLSGVTGILIHVNFFHDTKFWNLFFNTSHLHRWHHQKNTMYHNYGKVLCLWDWVFKTRYENDNTTILQNKYESHYEF